MPYPAELGARIVEAAGVGTRARALGVGCGPGSLTLLLAGCVDQIVGIDAGQEMLAEAAATAERAGSTVVPDGEIEIYRGAGFAGPVRIEVERGEVVERSAQEVLDATFSLSSSTPHLFGARRERFEEELRALLQAADDGRFCERVRDIVLDLWRAR